MRTQYTYRDTLAASERIGWRIEDVIGGGKQLDFGRSFMPENLARVEPLDFLSADEKRTLNQIRGHAYLGIFGLVEEFIVPFVLDHVRQDLNSDAIRDRALLQFASEETKHIQLFRRFREEFEAQLARATSKVFRGRRPSTRRTRAPRTSYPRCGQYWRP